MKTKMLLFVFLGCMILFMPVNSTAQVPQGFSYQAVARDGAGLPIPNLASLPVQITIKNGSTTVYVEKDTASTNAFGLFTLTIGGGTPVTGTFANINWASGTYSMKVEADFGSGYLDMGTQPLLTVPFAMVAGTSLTGGAGFWTQNATDIYNSNSGNVAIGNTSSPNAKLLVKGGREVRVLPNSSSDHYISFYNSQGAEVGRIEEYGGTTAFTKQGGVIGIRARNGGSISFLTGDSSSSGIERMVITENGDIGIGAGIPPSAKLDLNTNTLRCGGVYFNNSDPTVGGFLSQSANAPITFHINGAMVMKINSSGTAYCKELEVKLPPFPDYVFDENYQLMSLDELELSIKKEKHLPGIPSAADIEENGIGVGTLQAKMMEKIEELTLYLIEANKEIEALKNEVRELKKVENNNR